VTPYFMEELLCKALFVSGGKKYIKYFTPFKGWAGKHNQIEI